MNITIHYEKIQFNWIELHYSKNYDTFIHNSYDTGNWNTK